MKTLRICLSLAVIAGLFVAVPDTAQAQPTVPPETVPYAPPLNPPPAAPSAPITIDPFLPPHGMVTAPECLLSSLGFYGHHAFVYSAQNCFDLASAAYKFGYYEDAIALLSHAIEQDPQARYYFLRGMSQMQAGFLHDAIESADGVWKAQSAGLAAGLTVVAERFNGPTAVNFRELLKLRAPQERGQG